MEIIVCVWCPTEVWLWSPLRSTGRDLPFKAVCRAKELRLQRKSHTFSVEGTKTYWLRAT